MILRKRFALWSLLIAAILAAGIGIAWQVNGRAGAGKPASIIIAYSPFESTALVWIAEDRQFFRRNGLDITPRKYDSGAGALDGVINGEAELVVGTTEFPLVGKAFQQAKIHAIAGISKSDFIYLIARKDRGIEQVADLKGKRVGTTLGTIAEFYLGRFLTLNGMSLRDITVVDLKKPEEWINAVADGDVDAISTAQPYADAAKKRLGDNAVVWPAQSSQRLYALVIAANEWITSHPELAVRLLKSLAQAEDYTERHPAEAKAIVGKRLNLDAEYMETVWSQNQFTLSLDQSLILAMEDEARWMMKNNLTTAKQMPIFLDFIYEDGLKAVKPAAVNIIR